MRIFLCTVFWATLFTTGNIAGAATFSANSSGTSCGSYQDSGSSTNGDAVITGGSASTPTGDCSISSSARVGSGFLSTIASGQVVNPAQGGAFAIASITESFTITTPSGADPSAAITVYVGFNTDALLFTNAPTNSSGSGTSVARHRLQFQISGFDPGGGNAGSTSGDRRWEAVSSFGSNGTGALIVAPVTIFSNPINIAPSGDLRVSFSVETSWQFDVQQFDPSVDGFADASNTASFATSGPAFILPEGYFINAPDLGIVDNYWIDPRVPSPVPLPATLPMLLASVLMLGALKRASRTS